MPMAGVGGTSIRTAAGAAPAVVLAEEPAPVGAAAGGAPAVAPAEEPAPARRAAGGARAGAAPAVVLAEEPAPAAAVRGRRRIRTEEDKAQCAQRSEREDRSTQFHHGNPSRVANHSR